MFATPLTLSAAALSWIPWLNFNRCSTMRIRQGDLAVLFHRVAHSACIMRMSPCVFGFYFFFSARTQSATLHAGKCTDLFFSCICMCSCLLCACARQVGALYSVQQSTLCVCVLPHSAQGHVLSRKELKNQRQGVLWLIWNIDSTLRVDLPLIHGYSSADVRGKVSICSPMDAHTYTYI